MEFAEGLWSVFQKEKWVVGKVSWVDGVRAEMETVGNSKEWLK